jgi:hypothetical protein
MRPLTEILRMSPSVLTAARAVAASHKADNDAIHLIVAVRCLGPLESSELNNAGGGERICKEKRRCGRN